MTEYKDMLHVQRACFGRGECKNVEFRIRQLKNLCQWICEHEQELQDDKFDYIFFTGSANLGKYLMEKGLTYLRF